MKNPAPLALLLGALLTACYEDRGVLYVSGTAGQTGAAGQTSAAGQTGAAGSGGGSAPTNDAGVSTNLPGCDSARSIFTAHMCALNGACHDANGTAANLDLASVGWEARLVGFGPRGGGQIPSMCANRGRVYLEAGSYPARGLFLDKLFQRSPPCGDQMPLLPPLLDDAEKACIQRWADELTGTIAAP